MRTRARTLLALGLLVSVAGCGGAEDGPIKSGDGGSAQRPQDGGGDPPPVGDGEGGVALEELGRFDQPLYVAGDPGDPDGLYVVEQCGRIQRVPLQGGAAETFLDISGQVTCGGEQGLLSVAFAPAAGRQRRLYVYFTDTAGTTRIVEYTRSSPDGPADLKSARELLAIEDFAPNHNGGQLQFGPDGYLYIGTGDGGGAGDPERTAQDLSSLLGKILRIDPRATGGKPYGIPGDNPHADERGARPEILAHGLRNPWRFSFDPETDDLWIGDVGQDDREEIDAVTAGELSSGIDFGWSAFEGTQRFNEDQEAPEAVAPVLEYGRDRGCSVTGGYVVRDTGLPSLYGRYVYGDFCGGELWSLPARRPGDTRPGLAADDDRPLGASVSALNSFGVDLDGRVYATSLDGPVYRLVAE